MIRSVVFALLTAWIATLTALQASATKIIEPPSPNRATLDWTDSREALQTRLHQALASLATRDPSRTDPTSIFESTLLHQILDDGFNRIDCRSAQQGNPHTHQYRCEFTLASRYLDWTSKKNSIPAILFDAIDSLIAKNGGPGLHFHEGKDSRVVGLSDESTSSQIVCEQTRAYPTTFDALYRCQIDIGP